ncbi:MAG: TM2 domain-containing protein [Oscillospiraceae bacterium]
MTDLNNPEQEQLREKTDSVAEKADRAIENDANAAPVYGYPPPPAPTPPPPHAPVYPNANNNPYPGTAPQQPPYGQPQYRPYGQQYSAPQPPPVQPTPPPAYEPYPSGKPPQQPIPYGYEAKSRLIAALLGILLGAIGIHNFYLGNVTRGVIQIVVTILTCGLGGIWGFIEGILIICGHINYDANGYPLVK